MTRPTQAVILAGGRGERLRPLTEACPKPMLEFHGKPFLGYLMELLREQGIERVLLLLGYLPEAIQAYCGDGSRWGVQVDTVVSPVEDETGTRLRRAADRLDPVFLFMYCDNYWPMRLDRMWERCCAADAEALLTVYDNRDRYTKDNVRLDGDGRIVAYDKDRAMPGLAGVEIGYGLLRRDVLRRLPDGNVNFERAVYPRLAAEGCLWAWVTGHRYYSLSSPERLPLTAQFLARRPAVLLDRDGVLNARPVKARYVCSWADWQWLPGALDALRLLREAGARIIVVSNQAGIARGAMTEQDLATIHARMREEAQAAGGAIDAIYYCPHGWDEGCECRKPRPGMLYQAQREWHLDLSRTPFFGDDERDGEAAEAAGCPFEQVSETRTLLDVVRERLSSPSVQRTAYSVERGGTPIRSTLYAERHCS